MDTLRVDSSQVAAAGPAPLTRPAPPKSQVPGGPEPAPKEAMGPANDEAGSTSEIDPAALEAAVKELERQAPALEERGLEISYSEEADRFIAKILDKESGEVVRQFPPEELLELHGRLDEVRGVLFDDRG